MPSCSGRLGGREVAVVAVVVLMEAEPPFVGAIGRGVVIANRRPRPRVPMPTRSKGMKERKPAIEKTPSHCRPRGGGSLPRTRRAVAAATKMKERRPKRGSQGLLPPRRRHHPRIHPPPPRHLPMTWTIPSWPGWRSCDRCATRDDKRLAAGGRPAPHHRVKSWLERGSRTDTPQALLVGLSQSASQLPVSHRWKRCRCHLAVPPLKLPPLLPQGLLLRQRKL